jgi:uncharacterized lipoprotein YehR (DUF1307 family)
MELQDSWESDQFVVPILQVQKIKHEPASSVNVTSKEKSFTKVLTSMKKPGFKKGKSSRKPPQKGRFDYLKYLDTHPDADLFIDYTRVSSRELNNLEQKEAHDRRNQIYRRKAGINRRVNELTQELRELESSLEETSVSKERNRILNRIDHVWNQTQYCQDEKKQFEKNLRNLYGVKAYRL